MSKPSITEAEIALIKAMTARKMPNKDIQFFFNRPDRPVNSGRISNIKNGTYANSATIAAVDEPTLLAFLEAHKPTSVSAVVTVPAPLPPPAPNSHAALEGLFFKDGAKWRLSAGESDEHECKANYGTAYSDKWLRAVAALANNRGGYVLFGVHDKDSVKADGVDLSYAVIGMQTTEFNDTDTVKITQLLTANFDPTPRIQKSTIDLDGMSVGVLCVEQHASRPVIATKQIGDIREGDIFYRYPAQSRRIKYSDLRSMLDERDRQARQNIIPMIERLIALGPDKALLADLEIGCLGDGRNVIHLDPHLVEKLKFIKEGEFRETDGAPALKLLGEIETVSGESGQLRKGFATKADLIADFLKQRTPADPKEYVRLAVEGTMGEWLPIHFFGRKARLDPPALGTFIMAASAPAARRAMFARRAIGKDTAFRPAGGAAQAVLQRIERGEVPEVTTEKDAATLASAVQGMGAIPQQLDVSKLLAALDQGVALAKDTPKQVTMSVLRRGICRLDELMYGPKSRS